MNRLDYEEQDVDALAAEQNCTVVYPNANQLQLDIDSQEAQDMHLQLLGLYSADPIQLFKVVLYESTPSKSGHPHRHVTITLQNDITDEQRITLQALLGSDRKRELISLRRLLNGETRVTRFFEPKLTGQGSLS